jgi:hypothetical protein
MEKAIAQRREAKKKKMKAPDPSMVAPESLERDADELDVQFERVLVQMGVRRKTRHALPLGRNGNGNGHSPLGSQDGRVTARRFACVMQRVG